MGRVALLSPLGCLRCFRPPSSRVFGSGRSRRNLLLLLLNFHPGHGRPRSPACPPVVAGVAARGAAPFAVARRIGGLLLVHLLVLHLLVGRGGGRGGLLRGQLLLLLLGDEELLLLLLLLGGEQLLLLGHVGLLGGLVLLRGELLGGHLLRIGRRALPSVGRRGAVLLIPILRLAPGVPLVRRVRVPRGPVPGPGIAVGRASRLLPRSRGHLVLSTRRNVVAIEFLREVRKE